MARYMDADKYLDELYKQICSDCIDEDAHCCSCGVGCARGIAREMATVDVAPKSEVERLETEVRLLTENSISAKYPCRVSCSKGLILTKSLEEYDKLLADISSEVAREIFEEIETYLFYHENIPNTVYKTIDKNIFTRIKKKYTEENK